MSQPSVNISELDGALGILPPSAGRLYALAGVSSSGTANTPATYARAKDVITDFGAGPLVEAACYFIEKYGRPCVVVRTGQTTAGTVGAVTSVATGTSVVTITASPTPNDDYELYVIFVTGGTRGVAGATYQYSLDGGRTLSPVTALGTAVSITIPGAGGVSFALAAGTFIAGDYHTARSVAPSWTAGEMTTALTALKNSVVSWELCHVVGILDGAAFDAVETAFQGMFNVGKRRTWFGNGRMPTVGESEASYLTAMGTALGAKSTKLGAVCFGACKLSSAVSGRIYKRPVAFAYAALEASVTEEIDTADVNRGPIPGVSISDANGNPDEHDESIYPGGDDARFVTLRTIPNYPGVYVNRPLLYSSPGSDFDIVPKRRVINLAHDALDAYFTLRLNRPVLVSIATGYILEAEALEIEEGARGAMRARLMAKPKASGVQFTLSRFDNLLSTKTMTGSGRVIPLAYPEEIDLDVGYINPALQVQAV